MSRMAWNIWKINAWASIRYTLPGEAAIEATSPWIWEIGTQRVAGRTTDGSKCFSPPGGWQSRGGRVSDPGSCRFGGARLAGSCGTGGYGVTGTEGWGRTQWRLWYSAQSKRAPGVSQDQGSGDRGQELEIMRISVKRPPQRGGLTV